MTAHWRKIDLSGKGPLQGLRVLELSHVLAGSIAGLMLADMGADVIKIERPPRGDSQRWDVADEDSVGPFSASFSVLNRNKRSLSLDLKQASELEQVFALLSNADVLLHNYRPGVLENFGLGYHDLKERFPTIVYCSISGFGVTGPWAERGGFDLIAQAMSGIMSFTGSEKCDEPIKCGPPVTDIATGILAATGTLAALRQRQMTGIGDHVETSLLECGVMFTLLQSALFLASGVIPTPLGSAHPLYAPYEVYRAADGWIALGTANEANWRRLLELLGTPEIASDPRFETTSSRVKNRLALNELLSARFKTRARDEWIDLLAKAGVPCGPVLTIPEVLKHPQVASRSMVVTVSHPEIGSYQAIGCPIKFSRAGLADPKPAPLLNEH